MVGRDNAVVDRTIVELVRADGAIGASAIMRALEASGMSLSQATLSRRLQRLLSERKLRREGAARATTYRIDSYHEYFAEPPTRRRPVAYDMALLADYVPNRTMWLTEQETRSMEAAGGGRRMDASTYSAAIAQKLLVDLSYASSALEGNTYTYLDTQVLIEFGQEAEGKDRDETVMILNHKSAVDFLTTNIADITVTTRDVKTLHALLARGLSNMDPRDVGAIRTLPIAFIGGSAYKPLAVPAILEAQLATICAKAAEIENAFEASLFVMTFVSYLQAFRDVNKRTGRLACNIPLLKRGYAPMSFLDMDKTAYVKGLLAFYELGRHDLVKDAYVEGYVRSAARYDAYLGRPKEIVDIEFRRRRDLSDAVRAYVRAKATNPALVLEDFARSRFTDDEKPERTLMVERVAAIVAALGEGNHAAYGVTRAEYDAYAAGATPESDRRSLPGSGP